MAPVVSVSSGASTKKVISNFKTKAFITIKKNENFCIKKSFFEIESPSVSVPKL